MGWMAKRQLFSNLSIKERSGYTQWQDHCLPGLGHSLGHSLQAGHLTTSLVNIITSLIAVMLGHSLQGGHLTTDANVVANLEGDERSVRGANDKSTDHYAPIGSLMDGTNTMSRRTARTKSRDCHAIAKPI